MIEKSTKIINFFLIGYTQVSKQSDFWQEYVERDLKARSQRSICLHDNSLIDPLEFSYAIDAIFFNKSIPQ